MNSLNSIPGGIIGGVALAIILLVIMPGSGFNELSLARWLQDERDVFGSHGSRSPVQ